METFNGYGMGFPPREVIQQGLNIEFYQQSSQFRKLYDTASEFFQFDFYEESFGMYKKNKKEMLCLLLYCHGIAELVKERLGSPRFTMGYSQGEFAAITAGGGMKILEMMDLVDKLEEIIHRNKDKMAGKMCRIVGLSYEILQRICLSEDQFGKEVTVGIHISAQQNVIAGRADKVDIVSKKAKQLKAKYAISVGNSVFHSPLCLAIQDYAREVFTTHKFLDSEVDIYSCFSGEAEQNAEKIRENVSNQIANPVQWKKICDNIISTKVRNIVEIGPGTTVSGNMRLNNPQLQYNWINSPKELDEVTEHMNKSLEGENGNE